MVNPAKSWPRASNRWIAWVTKLSLHFRGLWITLGIERFIHLTTVNTLLDVESISVAFKLWSKRDITITLRDITILNGLHI